MTSPYRNLEKEAENCGRWIYHAPDICPYCKNQASTIKYGNESVYAFEIRNTFCRPHKRLFLLKKKRWWFTDLMEECPEPGHHIHCLCGMCGSAWLSEIVYTRTSEAK